MPSKVEHALHEAVEAPLGSRRSRRPSLASKTCILTFHDEGWCKQTVLVSPELFSPNPLRRVVLQIVPAPATISSSPTRKDARTSSSSAAMAAVKKSASAQYVFTLEPVSQDVLAGYPSLEVSILQPIATALGFANRSKVLISEVEAEDHLASHVEIAFKDAFLTRADMWRLLTSDLVGTSIYRNQKVLFVNSVKANAKAIYVKGRRVQSALLDASTKAIFRSDSSRYYILLQMSREMWDFDSDGGGEIIFNKVINGFLPELFRRWESLGTTHSVSVILFTRMEYEDYPDGAKHQDFYHVLTTELTSSESARIIQRLKEVFRTFLRDVSVSHISPSEQHRKIEGRPAAAIHGNILEAIYIASLQFLRSNATCDLRRTGLSIIVLTPGTGVYEVNHGLLNRTTETLIENGIYIDLVCFAKVPLHSSPLFRYKTGRATKSFRVDGNETTDTDGEWVYTIPHWVDVSFWQSPSSSDLGAMSDPRGSKRMYRRKKFVPRVRMYEVQMTGLMQNEFSISIPRLHCPHSVRFPSSFGLNTKLFKPRNALESHDLEGAKAMYNQTYKELDASGSPSKSPSQSHMQPFADLLNWMDDYDEAAFRPQGKEADMGENARIQGKSSLGSIAAVVGLQRHHSDLPTVPTQDVLVHKPVGNSPSSRKQTPVPSPILPRRKTSSASVTSKHRVPTIKLSQFSRQFGPGFKGFGAAKAIATTQVSAEPVVSDASSAKTPSESTGDLSGSTLRIEHDFPSSSTISRPSTRASAAISAVSEAGRSASSTLEKSKPIDIRPKQPERLVAKVRDERELMVTDLEKVLPQMLPAGDEARKKQHAEESPTARPVTQVKSPWMTMLNPSNPKKSRTDMTNRLGRWQHVFPKPTQVSTIKWKSLCSPACLPLTTEEFPSVKQLEDEYEVAEYEVRVPKEKENRDSDDFGEWLIRELIASRLTRGYSVVVGTRPAEALGLPQAQWYEFLHEKGMSQPGVRIVMSRGTEIHELFNVRKGVVQITKYVRNRTVDLTMGETQEGQYNPLIRTAYARSYVRRNFPLFSKESRIDWERLDNFIANDEEDLNKPYPKALNYWRARFVLIPIAVSTARKRNHSSEDNEEEVRLEGIRKLTELWQKNRYMSPNERKFEYKARRDANPLDIVYQTRSASAVVSELNENTILTMGPETKFTQLLPEKELFEKAKLNPVSLAKALQSDKGIRLMDRRWHWRLHYHCFIGRDLTTWIVNSFRDIDTREEAIEFGNDLMKEGLFVHVERRHNFRDGNFFYQITEKYRIPRPDNRTSWFGRLSADKSVPPTPIFEDHGEEPKRFMFPPPSAIASVPEENEQDVEDDGKNGHPKSAPISKQQNASAMLSKQLLYDMDHRKKSHRRELIHLHVDRISSADDCYHIRIDWVTATPKLIEDTVEGWATTAERSGLRLVEVPLLEAWRFTDTHPFRHPYFIKLARDPPRQPPHAAALDIPTTHGDPRPPTGGSSGPSPGEGSGVVSPSQHQQHQPSWPYHKAILKRFDFVLDTEASADFPSDVSVQYSWGAPDYSLPQYITRSGRLLAQITPDGRFLLLINQLYGERGSAAREAQRTAAGAGTGLATASVSSILPNATVARAQKLGESLEIAQQTPRRPPLTPGLTASAVAAAAGGPGINKLSLSPFSSPMLRAAAATSSAAASIAGTTSDLQSPGSASLQLSTGTPLMNVISPHSPLVHAQGQGTPKSRDYTHTHTHTHQQQPPPLSRSEVLTVTELRIELEAFCSDPLALERFYDEELHRPVATVPATPIVRPLTIITGIEEAVSAIPPALSLKDEA